MTHAPQAMHRIPEAVRESLDVVQKREAVADTTP